MTVADFVAMLASGAASVLPWVGAGVSGAIALLFLFLGIRQAFRFFRGISDAGSPSSGGRKYKFNDDWDRD